MLQLVVAGTPMVAFFAATSITHQRWTPVPSRMPRRNHTIEFRQVVAAAKKAFEFQQLEARLVAASRRLEERQGLELWSTPEGDFWTPPGTNLAYVLAEQVCEVYGRGPYGVQEGDVVLDCGANVGVFTRTALRRGARLVIAIEPVPANCECLRRTFQGDIERGSVVVCPKGVWNERTELAMYLYKNSVLDSFVMDDRPEEGRHSEQLRLPLTTIDELVPELGLDRVDYIKMDVEGAEAKALQGAAATLRRWKPRLSIATENLPDDPYVLPGIVKRIEPSYHAVCGPCTKIDTDLRAEVK